MIIESQRVNIKGYLLHRLVLHPDVDVPVRAAAMFYHGQGDYGERYGDILGDFTRRGVRCFVTELPGHGLSPGRRGHCGDTALLDAVVADSLKAMNGLPYGVMGHSMGGLLATRHLVLAGLGRLPVPVFCWLSSPLMVPSKRRSAFVRFLIRWLSPIMPSLTVSTGVVPVMCRVKSEDNEGGVPEASLSPPKHRLWHNRVSMGWGACLLDYERLVASSLESIPKEVPLLFTQGELDPICPAETAREYFSRLPNEAKDYHEFPEMLHEPFRGEGSERLFAVLEEWLDGEMAGAVGRTSDA